MSRDNGRIDRTLQSEPEVRCHYFVYADRKEDIVLDKLAKKVETIQRELGSFGAVIMRRIESDLEKKGIDADTAVKLDETEREKDQQAITEAELEKARADRKELARALAGPGSRADALGRLSQDFPPAGLAVLDYDKPNWAELAPGEARLIRFFDPA